MAYNKGILPPSGELNPIVLDKITEFSENFPKEALREIQSDREKYIPRLLESLDYAYRNATEICRERSGYFLHTYAIYLLAEFREQRAFPLLLKLLMLPEDEINYILSDNITEGFCRALLCTFDFKYIQELLDIIENNELYEWARLSALMAYELLIKENFITKNDGISYLRSLIYDKLPPDDSTVVLTGIVGCITKTGLFDMIPDVRFMYDCGRVDPSVYGKFDDFLDWMFYRKREEPSYIDDAIPEMEWWACFKSEGDNKREQSISTLSDMLSKMEKEAKKETATVQKTRKIGRNEPCPCGSGKKYKKCCLDAQRNNMPAAVASIEERYDLLDIYPIDSELFMQMYEKEAIEIDMLVYKALHHRAIPMWVERDREQERLGKVGYLSEALALFTEKCRRERISSFSSYDERFMVHYRSSEWVSALTELIEDGDSDDLTAIQKTAEDTVMEFADS